MTGTGLRLFVAILFPLLASLSAGPPAWGGIASMSISPTGDNSFGLMGMAMEDIDALRITIDYDVSTMADLSISLTGIMAGAKYTSAVSNGTAQISATENAAVDGSGYIVMLDYTRVSDKTPGRIISASVYVKEKNGQEAYVPVVIENPLPQEMVPLPPVSRGSADNKANPPVGGASIAGETTRESGNAGEASPPVVPDHLAQVYRGGGDTSPPANSGPETGSTPQDEARRLFAYKSALTRIREFTGEKSEKNMLLFLAGNQDLPFRQEPFVALSDGKSSVRLIMDLDIKGKKGPIFVLSGAQFLSLKPRGSTWTLEVMPVQGVLEASVTAMYDDRMVEFPLTLAPPLSTYLKKRTDSAQAYIDTYVAVVNRLAKSAMPGEARSNGGGAGPRP
jgi:hypothetical protein